MSCGIVGGGESGARKKRRLPTVSPPFWVGAAEFTDYDDGWRVTTIKPDAAPGSVGSTSRRGLTLLSNGAPSTKTRTVGEKSPGGQVWSAHRGLSSSVGYGPNRCRGHGRNAHG
jgi:hypothetical protein